MKSETRRAQSFPKEYFAENRAESEQKKENLQSSGNRKPGTGNAQRMIKWARPESDRESLPCQGNVLPFDYEPIIRVIIQVQTV